MFIILEDSEWNKAEEYSEKILDINPKNANAYLAKLMIEYKVNKQEDLADCKKPLTQSRYFKRIEMYGDKELIDTLNSYNNEIIGRRQQRQDTYQNAITVVKDKSKTIIPVLIGIILIAVIVIFLIIPNLTNNNDSEPEINEQQNWLEYKGMTIRLPYYDKYSATIEDDTIVLKQEFDLTISEFLGYVYAPSGKSFTTSGSFASSNGSASFIIKDYNYLSVQYYLNGDWAGKTLDLIFCGYNKNYHPWYIDKDGRVPQKYTGAGSSGFIQMEMLNNGQQKFYFEYGGEVTILGQYSDSTTVEIKVVRK